MCRLQKTDQCIRCTLFPPFSNGYNCSQINKNRYFFNSILSHLTRSAVPTMGVWTSDKNSAGIRNDDDSDALNMRGSNHVVFVWIGHFINGGHIFREDVRFAFYFVCTQFYRLKHRSCSRPHCSRYICILIPVSERSLPV